MQSADGITRVFDPLRGKFVALTPEEWVRQNFVAYLVSHKGYPASLLANEVSITLNGTSRRCDTVLYDRHLRPLMIVEYKAPHIQLSQRTFNQVARYNIVLRTPWLILSNGLTHCCCQIDPATGAHRFLPGIPDFPLPTAPEPRQ
ncbi:MAG: type I restriction enzyme HsdR N-terminal domain-containing protein [Muribaculaceae bacterium]|nr:type I restriction enzyme HsdR N-terminal domain-containing protein [Muribaculaceae bacterium]MDE6629349.1 type I restriction enzyme HsdR N-terminal domain-containing protein [Muribaculaceae bacterium]